MAGIARKCADQTVETASDDLVAASHVVQIAIVGIIDIDRGAPDRTAGAQTKKLRPRLRVPRQQIGLVELIHHENRVGPPNHFPGNRLGTVIGQRNTKLCRGGHAPTIGSIHGCCMQTRRADLHLDAAGTQRLPQQCGSHRTAQNVSVTNEQDGAHITQMLRDTRLSKPQGPGHGEQQKYPSRTPIEDAAASVEAEP